METRIIEENKLIAEFMGGIFQPKSDRHPNNPHNKPTWWNVGLNKKVGNYELEYHSSWDWLMPVVEKIESNGYCFFIQNDLAWIKVGRAGMRMPEISCLSDSKIESVFKTVVQFIQWFNSQPTQL